jgi:hypothetical protein
LKGDQHAVADSGVQAGGHQDDLGAGPLGVREDRLDVTVVAAGHEDQDHVVAGERQASWNPVSAQCRTRSPRRVNRAAAYSAARPTFDDAAVRHSSDAMDQPPAASGVDSQQTQAFLIQGRQNRGRSVY